MESILLQNLSIGYATKSRRRLVASGISGAVRSGELTCLLGRNGVGKSTLLRTLANFQPPLEGDILMVGDAGSGSRPVPLSTLSAQQVSRLIGIVLTEKPHVRNMTVGEMVAMGRQPYTGFWGTLSEDDRAIVGEAVGQTGIGPLVGRMIQTLSDGERQKMMIAKALAQQTPVIYLDEPTAFLDFPSKVEVMQMLHRLATEQQKTILLSTHDVELALQLADRIWLMEPGALHVGTPQELALDGALSRFIERDGIHFDAQTLTIHLTR